MDNKRYTRTLLGLSCLAILFGSTVAYADYKEGLIAFVKKDNEKAKKELLKDAENGNPECAFLLWYIYHQEKNQEQEDKWLKKAAENGDIRAKTMIEFEKRYR